MPSNPPLHSGAPAQGHGNESRPDPAQGDANEFLQAEMRRNLLGHCGPDRRLRMGCCAQQLPQHGLEDLTGDDDGRYRIPGNSDDGLSPYYSQDCGFPRHHIDSMGQKLPFLGESPP